MFLSRNAATGRHEGQMTSIQHHFLDKFILKYRNVFLHIRQGFLIMLYPVRSTYTAWAFILLNAIILSLVLAIHKLPHSFQPVFNPFASMFLYS
jgi:hypothetical protein